MFSLKNLKTAKQEAESNHEQKDDKSDNAYFHALDYLEQFQSSQSYDKNLLIKASDKLQESLKWKSNRADAYICLAVVFYMSGETELAIKYNKIASLFAPESPYVKELIEIISSGSVYENQFLKIRLKQNDSNIDLQSVKTTKAGPISIKPIRKLNRS